MSACTSQQEDLEATKINGALARELREATAANKAAAGRAAAERQAMPTAK
jgi:hypothetical protein